MNSNLQNLIKNNKLSSELHQIKKEIEAINKKPVDPECPIWKKKNCKDQCCQLLDKTKVLFEDLVLRELVKPAPITLDDLVESFQLYATVAPIDGWYDHFSHHVTASASVHRISAPFPGIAGPFQAFDGMTDQHELWRGSTGLSIWCVGNTAIEEELVGQEDDIFAIWPRLIFFRVQGHCTSRALEQFQEEVGAALRTVLKSVESLSDDERGGFYPRKPVQLWIEEHVIKSGDDDGYWDLINPRIIRPLLDAYFGNVGKKDTFNRRIRNALHLLVESDRQAHDAVALSLSVAAIEALLCRKGSDLTSQISENAAVLLEPDSHFRDDATNFVRNLYDIRSRTLHGDLVADVRIHRLYARQLAAAVFLAILQRREYQSRMGIEAEPPDDFFSEIRASKWVPGPVPGVTLSPVRKLWQNNS